MKKLFFIAFALMLSFSTAFAGGDNHRPELARNEEPDAGGGGGGTGGFIVIVFRGWCGQAHVQKVYDHEPSYLETLGPQLEAKAWCDKVYGGPFSLIGVD